LPVGEHIFKGTFTKKGASAPLEFVFKVEEGNIISSHATEHFKYSLNGVIQDGKLTLKQQFEGEGHLEAEFDGEFDGANKIKGVYKSNNGAVYDETGHFEITKV
jgi:hypothetical protein